MTQTLEFIPPLLEASVVTVEITILSAALAFVLAFVAGLARLSRLWVVRALASAYIEFFRGTSLLVQLFWLFYVLPHFGLTLPPLSVAVLGLGLNAGSVKPNSSAPAASNSLPGEIGRTPPLVRIPPACPGEEAMFGVCGSSAE